MKRLAQTLTALTLLAALFPLCAQADFGFNGINVTFTGAAGQPPMQAGSHPLAMATSFNVNTVKETVAGKEKEFVDGALRDLDVFLPPGFTGNVAAVPPCSTIDFLTKIEIEGQGLGFVQCPDSSAVGVVQNTLGTAGTPEKLKPIAVYSLEPPPGALVKLGFWVVSTPVTLVLGLNPNPPYNVIAKLRDTAQTVEVFGSVLTAWGNPADPIHDPQRGNCALQTGKSCKAGIPEVPFMTLPRSCTGPLLTIFKATSWWSGAPLEPGPPAGFEEEVKTRDQFGELAGTSGCSKLGLASSLSAKPTTENAESPTGLDLSIDIKDDGFANPSGNAGSDIKKAVVALPEGMTANPSAAEGLDTCSLAELEDETLTSEPGQGCPQASKLGSIELETPALPEKLIRGQIFIASQDDPTTTKPGAENPFDTLLALYMVIKDPGLGIILKLPGKVEPDPKTGQLISTFDDLPQQPVSHFRFHFREGGRSPLISPPACGTYQTKAEFSPWSDPDNPLPVFSDFQITQGVGGGPCPPAGPSPFAPGFSAGSLNNNAGSYSPFNMRLTRRDGDQDLTRFDATLPPGMVGKLAGLSQCPESAIAAAKAKSGRAELASPSCPASSEIGHTLAGAGVGSQLTYVPGKLYLAGPFGGAPLSVVAITPAVTGPFDVGAVVVREALQVNPRTAQVQVDGAHSDPIPHILAGIPLRVRDIRVHADRPQFTFNPTNCSPFATTAQIWGGGLNVFSAADDAPVSRSERFQAANCARLGFKPKLALKLKGGTKRGGHPKLTGTYTPRPGDANLSELVLRFPHSAFLDQGHIRTICTRVQFAADACPKGAIYGFAKAFTPILDDPLQGPVYLRSSNHNLPDLVFDLHGLVDFEAVFRIDSKNGGIRATFEGAPDAPITKAIVEMQGGKKGLIVNSRDICATNSSADLRLTAQSNKRLHLHPQVKPSCGGKAKRR